MLRYESKDREVKLRVDRFITIPKYVRQIIYEHGIDCEHLACFDFRSPNEIYIRFCKESNESTCRAILCKNYEWYVRVPPPIVRQILAVYGITENDIRFYRAEVYIRYEPTRDPLVWKLVHRAFKV